MRNLRKSQALPIVFILLVSSFSVVFWLSQSIVEKKIVEITLGGTTIRYEVINNRVVSRSVIRGENKAQIHGNNLLVAEWVRSEEPINGTVYTFGSKRKKSGVLSIMGTEYILMAEDFEGEDHTVPGMYWESEDNNFDSGRFSWTDVHKDYGFRAYSGNWSMWCNGWIYNESITGIVSGDGTTSNYDYNDTTSPSWFELGVYLLSGETYSYTMTFNSSEDLDVIVYDPNGTWRDDASSYSGGPSEPESKTFTADITGWWIFIIDDWQDTAGAVSEFTLTFTSGPVWMNIYKDSYPRYAPDMDALAYYYEWFDVSKYDVAILEFYTWYETVEGYDFFEPGFYVNKSGTLVRYVASYDGSSGGWVKKGLLLPDEAYSYPITPLFSFISTPVVEVEGAYVDDIALITADITLDDYYVTVNPAHPGDTVVFKFIVDNPLDWVLPNVNMSVYLRPAGWSNPWKIYNLTDDLLPGQHEYNLTIPVSDLDSAPLGYYDVRYVVWGGEPLSSRIWDESGWLSSYWQVKHYTDLNFLSSQYSGRYGDTITITAHIEDSNTNSPLEGKDVTLYYYDGHSWVSLGTSTSNSSGDVEWTITLTMDAGTYDLKIEFKGDDEYEPSSATLSDGLVVDPEITQISFDQQGYTVQYSDTITISCVLTDDEGNPLVSKLVYFYYSTDGSTWTYWFSAYTDTSGRASKSVAVTLDPDNYYIKAQFNGDKNYQPSYAQTTLTVNQESTQTTLDSESYVVDYNDLLTITATLKDDDGQNVDGRTVYFEYYDGSSWVVLDSDVTSNGVASISINADLTPGGYTIRAIFYGDKQYISSYDTATLTVNKETTSLTNPSISGHYLDYVTITTTLTEDGNPLGGYTIYFYVDNNLVGSNTTEKDGTAKFRYLLDLIPGTHSVRVEFPGNTYYESSSCQGSLDVYKEITVLSDPSTSGVYSDKATIGSTLTDDEGNPIESKLLTFSMYVGGSWSDLGSNTTDKSGYAYVAFVVEWPAGSYSVKVSFAGDTYYESVEQSGILTISKEKTALDDPSTSGYYSDSAVSTTYLTDDDKSPVPNVWVDFKVYYDGSWISLGSNQTDDNGMVRLKFTVDLPYGEYDLNVSFSGNEYYEGTYRIGTLTVLKEITELSNISASGYYSDSVTLVTYLLTDDKEPVSGRIVVYSIYINGSWSTLGNAYTQSDGKAELTVDLNYTPDTYSIEASFVGDNYYDSCETTGQLVIYKEKTVLSDPSTSGHYSDDIVIGSVLTDDEHVGISDRALTFEIRLGDSWQTLGSNTTNSNGEASLRILLSYDPGTYDLKVMFNGDEYYEPCEAYGTLTVRKEIATISAFESSGNYSDTVLLVAKLTDDDNTPLENLVVGFNVSSDNITWIFIGEAYTNSSGYAELSYVIDLPYGNYTLKAYFEGNDYYEATCAYSTLIVLREEVVIMLDSQSYTVNYSDSLKILVRAIDNEGDPITDTTICVNVSDILLGSGMTNESGYTLIDSKIDLEPSQYTLLIYHKADEYYEYGEAQAELIVGKEETMIIEVSGIGRYGDENAVIQARLVDNENTSIEQRTIEFYFYNESDESWEYLGCNITNSDGYATIKTALTLPFGEYDLNATFNGDQYYQPASSLGTLSVDKEITIIIAPNSVSGKYLSQITITIRLVDDENETYLANTSIEFVYWNGTQNVSLGSKITNSSGYVDMVLDLTEIPGTYHLYAIYGGNQYYYGAEKDILVIIEKLTLNISNPAGSGNYSDMVGIEISIFDEYGGLYNGSVLLELNESGKWVMLAETNSVNGRAVFNLTINVTPGEYQIRARVPESEIYLESLSNIGVLEVYREESKLVVTLNSTFEYGDELIIHVVLEDNEEIPIQNRTLTMIFANATYNITTGRDGVAKLSLSLNYDPSNYSLSICFMGDEYYVESSYTTSIRVVQEETLMIIQTNGSVIAGGTIEIVVNLLDDDGNPIANKSLLVYVNDSYDGEIICDEYGVAKYTYTAPNITGEITIHFAFEGDTYYESSDAQVVIRIILPRIEILTDRDSYQTNYTDELTISITLLNYTGDPIPKIEVVLLIDIDGNLTQIAVAVTDNEGVANISWKVLLVPGIYDAYIYCPELSDYNGSSKHIIIIINKETTMLRGVSETIKAEYTDYYTVGVYLATDDNEPIAGEELNLYLVMSNDTTHIGSAITNADGYAEMTILCDLIPGNYSILIVFNETNNYLGSITTINLVVENEKLEILSLSISPEKIFVNKEVTIVVVIGENDENIIYVQDANVSLYVDGELLASQRTGSDGKAIFKWMPRKVGQHRLSVVVQKEYYESASTTIVKNVYSAPAPIGCILLIGSITIVALGIVIYIVKRKRRSIRSGSIEL